MPTRRSRETSGANEPNPPNDRGCYPAFSHSQVEQIKKALRYDIYVDNASTGLDSSQLIRGGRPLLGQYLNRSPMEELDFDGDGKRDLAVWEPPVGSTPARFLIALSTQAWSTGALRPINLGAAGDIPVPADYDGDRITDPAVIDHHATNPASNSLTWRWCKSTVDQTCSSIQSFTFGLRYDVPLPGTDFDGNPDTGEVAVWRSTDRKLYWRRPGIDSSSTVIQLDTSAVPEIVHLHGQYDCHEGTDVAWYVPSSGTARILTSGSGWSAASVIIRYFPAARPRWAPPSRSFSSPLSRPGPRR